MKKIRLVILSIFIFQTSFCQENYLPGYIVSNGDTLYGFIDYRNWEGNPDKIFFKEKLNDKKSMYSPMDIKGFSVHDEMYESAIVKTGISSTEINALELDSELQYAIDTIFLQTIIKGKKSLYFYMSEAGKAQFYIKQDSSYVLLIYNKYLKEQDGKTGTAENRKYLGQLSFYFQDCPTIQSKLTSTGYTKKSMENLFLDYYNCAQSKLEFRKKTEKTIAEFGVFAGLSLTSLKFNAIDYLMNADCDPSANLSAGLFFEVIPPRNQRKWSLNNELIFSSYKIKGFYNDYENENRYTIYHTTIEASYLKMNNMLRYKYPVGNLFVYLNAGISNGFAVSETNTVKKESKIYSSERIDEEVILNETRKYEQGYILGLGTKYKRYSFEVRYENGNGMSVSSQLKSSSNRFYFLLGCKF